MIAELLTQPNGLLVRWQDGTQHLFPYIWLRDNGAESRTDNGQRLIETSAIPDKLYPSTLTLAEDKNSLTIVWAPDQYQSHYTAAWLYDFAKPPAIRKRTVWDAQRQAHLAPADYDSVCNDPNALKEWLQAVYDDGFALLKGVPARDGAILDVVRLFGYVRETNYGRIFDVRSVVSPNNLAFTSLPLSVHTDNPYREPVPTLQLLHCLASDVQGGDSILVDGFAVAEALRQRDSDAFHLLATQPVRFRFHDEHSELTAESPIIRLDAHGEIVGIRFNNRSIAPFTFSSDIMEAYYAAYRTFARLLNDEQFVIRFKMDVGDCFIVDNERVLHGRSGFSSDGQRHLQGCYADRDSLYSRLAILKRKG